jgi:hypothetical protein
VAEQRYWRAAEARVVVEAWRASGEELGAFAARYGIHPRRVGRWAGQLGREDEEAAAFHPVRLVRPTPTPGPGAPIEIVLGEACGSGCPGASRQRTWSGCWGCWRDADAALVGTDLRGSRGGGPEARVRRTGGGDAEPDARQPDDLCPERICGGRP